MEDFKDLNELLVVARQINEGKYSLINININPESEFYAIAKYFTDSVVKLQTASSAVGDGFNSLPIFREVWQSFIDNSKKASGEVLASLDKVNANVATMKDILEQIDVTIKNNDRDKALFLVSTLQEGFSEGLGSCLDIVASLQFRDVYHDQVDKTLEIIDNMQEQIAMLAISLGLKERVISSEVIDSLSESKEMLNDQALVDKLLRDLGI